MLDLLYSRCGWVSSVRLVFFVIVVVALPRPHCRRSVFLRVGSPAFFCWIELVRLASCVVMKIQNREKEETWKHMYGQTPVWRVYRWPPCFLARGWVSMLRLVFFAILVVVLSRPHCRRSVFSRVGSLAFFVDRVRASWVRCL